MSRSVFQSRRLEDDGCRCATGSSTRTAYPVTRTSITFPCKRLNMQTHVSAREVQLPQVEEPMEVPGTYFAVLRVVVFQ